MKHLKKRQSKFSYNLIWLYNNSFQLIILYQKDKMSIYSKSLEDYFHIPILIKPITSLTEKTLQRLTKIFYYKHFSFPITEPYIRHDTNTNTNILQHRQNVTQKLYFLPQIFNNDWPEFQIIYKIKFAIGVIDEPYEEKQIQQILAKNKMENGVKIVGIMNMSTILYENLFKKQNIIKCPEMDQQQFVHFMEPWLYNCLSSIESQICNFIHQAKKDEQNNRTIVFNRMEQKFDQKIMKRKKKYRCIKLVGDYHLMLHLYKQAFDYFNEAEQLLKKIDDYLWILGCLQGKLACAIVSPEINISNREQYIEELINETYSIAKKVKNWNFQSENYFKIIKLYQNQPEKIDELVRNFITNYSKNLSEDQKFLLFTTIGDLFEKCGLMRKKNYFYFLSSMIHLNKKSQISTLLLTEIQKTPVIKEWSELYKKILQQIIHQNENNEKTNEFYLELISKCAHNLTEKEIGTVLSQLNFSNTPIIDMPTFQFIKLKQFYVIQSPVKPKQNRIGNRESPRKVGGGFFMSWKKDDNLLFEQGQQIQIKGAIANKIPFPLRLKIQFNIHALTDPAKICSKQELSLYLEPNITNKFEATITVRGEKQEIWVIDKLNIIVWSFQSSVDLPCPIKYQIYEKQPELDLALNKQLIFQETSNIVLKTKLMVKQTAVTFCLVKLNISIYYSIDVGFQQNQVILREDNQFMALDFDKEVNLNIIQNQDKDYQQPHQKQGILTIYLKKFKAHRRFISRIEFTIEYIKSLESKYQMTKQYVCKCSFYQQFNCVIQDITTPILQKLHDSFLNSLKIIDRQYKYKIKISKNTANDNKSYIFRYCQKEYRLNNSFLVVGQIRQKIQCSAKEIDIREIIYWEEENNQQTKGQIEICIPYHPLMKKSQKEVKLIMQQESMNNHKKVRVEYKITSQKSVVLSHRIILNPVDVEIDKMYVMRGKNKIQSIGNIVSNQIEVIFHSKCKNNYQIGVVFDDGWVYWHEQIIQAYPCL